MGGASRGEPGIGTSEGKSGDGALSGLGCGTSLGMGGALELAMKFELARAGLCMSLARYLLEPFLEKRMSNVG